MKKIEVPIKNISQNSLPEYQTLLSAGMDVRADFSRATVNNPITLKGSGKMYFKGEDKTLNMLELDPGARALIPTGLFVSIPDGYELQLRARSGLALKSGISLCNGVGTLDADFRGEIGVIIINHGQNTIFIEDGERVCQMVLNEISQAKFLEVAELDETARGLGGFGHTGKI